METFMKFYSETKFSTGNQKKEYCEYSEAIQKYDEAISVVSNDYKYYGERAVCKMSIGNFEDALKDARQSILLNDKYGNGYLCITKCCLANGDLQKAEEAYDYFLENSRFGLDDSVEVRNNLKVLKTETLNIKHLFEKEDYNECLQSIENLLVISSASVKLKLKKAECLSLLSRFDEAKTIVNDIIENDILNAEAFFVLGLIFFYKDDLEKAIVQFENCLRNDQSHQNAKELRNLSKTIKDKKTLANRYFQEKKLLDALDIYKEILEFDLRKNKEITSKLYLNCALVNSALYQIPEGIENCNKAIELNAQYFKAFYKRAQLFYYLGDYYSSLKDCWFAYGLESKKEAKTLFLQAANAMSPEDKRAKAESVADLVDSCVYNQNIEEDIQIYSEALVMYPMAEVLCKRISNYLDIGNYECILKDLQLMNLFEDKTEEQLPLMVKCYLMIDDFENAYNCIEELKGLDNAEENKRKIDFFVEMRLIIDEIKKLLKMRAYSSCLVYLATMEEIVCLSSYYKIIKAECLMMILEFEEAINILNNIKPNSQVHYLNGYMLYQNEHFTEAKFELSKSIQMDKNNSSARKLLERVKKINHHYICAENLYKKKFYDKASRMYMQIIPLIHDNPKFMQNVKIQYSYCMIYLKQYTDCIELGNRESQNNFYEASKWDHIKNIAPNMISRVDNYFETEILSATAKSHLNMHDKLWKEFKHEEAIESMTKAIEILETNSNYYCIRANDYLYLNKFSLALEDAKNALKYDAQCMASYNIMVRCYFNMGNLSALGSVIDKLRDGKCKDPIYLNLISIYEKIEKLICNVFMSFNNNKYENCIDDITQIMNLTSENDNLIILKVECLILLGKHKEAIQILKKVVQNNVTSADITYLNSLIHYLEGNLDNCILLLENSNLDNVKVKKIFFNSKSFKERIDNGRIFFNQNQFQDALIKYTEAINIDKTNKKVTSDLYLLCAQCNFELRYWKDCISDCNDALEYDPNKSEARYLLQRCRLYLEEIDREKKKASELLKCFNDGKKHMEQKNFKKASECFSDSIKLDDTNYEYYGNRALCYIEQYHYAPALSDCVRAVKLNEKYVEGYINAAKCSMLLGDTESEKLWFDKLEKKIDPVKFSKSQLNNFSSLQKIRKHFKEANAKFEKNEFEDCMYEIAQGFKFDLVSTHYDILRIECLIMVGRFSVANDLIEKLQNKGDPSISYIRGLLQYHKDKHTDAIKNFENYQKYSEKCEKTPQFLIDRMKSDKTSQYLLESYQIQNIIDEIGTNKNIKLIDLYISDIDNVQIKKRLYYQRALLNKKLNKHQEVIEDCTNALDIDSLYQNPRVLRAQTYEKKFQYDDCTKDLKKLMEIDSKNYETQSGKKKNFISRKFTELFAIFENK